MTKYTDNQQKVIDFNEGNIVVSASAGSGKTSVMIERIIRLILEGKANISEILAVTFTKATANEIKEKISKAIYKSINDENASRLKKQLEDLPLSSVSTVDSFCNGIVKKYFYLCDVDANFNILSAEDQQDFENRAIKDTFNELYEQGDGDLLELLSVFVNKRSDGILQNLIMEMYEFAVYEKSPDEFFKKAIENYSVESLKKLESKLIAKFVSIFHNFALSLTEICKRCLEFGFSEAYKFLGDIILLIDDVKYHTDTDDFISYISNISCGTISKKGVNVNTEFESIVNDYMSWRKKLADLIKNGVKIFEGDEQERQKMMLSSGENMQRLVKVERLFAENYAKLKKDYSVLDYADIEHFSLKVLENEQICKEIKDQFKFIFVDEYQDTNSIQEAIFEKLSNNNLFIVGDIKQSIYAFRGCNPHIFMQKIEACKNGYGLHINLDDNFRSSKAVIDGVNKIFSEVMLPENADVDYAASPMTGGTLYGDYLGECKLHIFEDSTQDNVEIDGVYSVKKHLEKLNTSNSLSQERIIANIILSKIGKDIFDIKTGQTRPLQFSDFAILTRKNTGVADKVLSELVQSGIPVISQSKRSIKSYPEVLVMINLVKLIVVPTNDIALATVLKSSIGGFSDSELSDIRANNPSGTFYEACMQSTQSGEFSKRLIEFFDYLKKIRLLAQFENASSVLSKVVSERGYELQLLSSRLGEVKLARVKRFITAGSNISIYELFEKLDSITSSMTVSSSAGENAVSIISMHSSKGLEFPVVIVAQVSKRYNITPNNDEVVFDRDFGFGLRYYDKQNKTKSKTFLRRLIEFKFRLELPAEEMRLFYVATTRAKNQLHILTDKIPSEKHRYELFYYGLYMSDFLSSNDMPIDDDKLDLQSEGAVKEERRKLIIGEADGEQVRQIQDFLDFKYSYAEDTALPLKRSVTEIVKNQSAEELTGEVYYQKQPLFVENAEETGTSYHKFLELCDFNKDASQLNDLIGKGVDENSAKLLDYEQLNKILGMSIFSKISNMKIYREQQFILNVPAKIVENTESKENVLVQGVIDLLALCNDGAYIIDYKFSAKTPEALKETYKKQLELYAYAVSNILHTPIKGKYLINIRTADEIAL